MSLSAKRELLFRMQSRYLVAGREQKGEILDGFVAATGYHRKYAASVLASTLAGLPANGNRIRTCKYDSHLQIRYRGQACANQRLERSVNAGIKARAFAAEAFELKSNSAEMS